MMRRIKVCIPIYFDEGYYPSAGAYADRSQIYWKTVSVLCVSIKRARIPLLDIVVSANEAPPSDIFNILDNCGVSFISPQFSFQPPKGLFPAFSGAFYLFDSMAYCRDNFSTDDIFAFIDPDCIVMKNFDILRNYSSQWPLVGYELNIEEDDKINGCSRNDLLAFLRTMTDDKILEAPRYFGGELLVVNGEAIHDICKVIDCIWKKNIINFKAGANTLKTEEHVVSVALALLASCVGSSDTIIKRMWTRPSFRNVSPEDRKYLIWHLPAEKRFAFQRVFQLVKDNISNFLNLNDAEFGNLMAQFIRLELTSMEKALYAVYPAVKKVFGI
jgi:hypothetical protein